MAKQHDSLLFNKAPWQVKYITLDEKAGFVTFIVDIADNAQLACPKCGKPYTIHDRRRRKWRHLDTCQFTTLVEANVPRICWIKSRGFRNKERFKLGVLFHYGKLNMAF